ncbi:prealbumin-like fold domain-containing protein [Kribbella sp. HUAS MG21]|uniref:Prealbumin-like fold domain-containing protein n=1 Tax=Kribbella sp. HUAS MG21 TaxID=3160966 RepID=A0AAU7T757_9ACTN
MNRSGAKGTSRRVGTRRRLTSGLTILVLAALGLAASTGSASATVSTDASFEFADGNLVHNTLMDWNDFSPTTWTGTAPFRTSGKTVAGWAFTGLEDAQATTSDTAFAGGVKQDNDCATLSPAKAPNKDDLKRVYVTSNTVGGDVFLGLAWVRIPQNTTSPSAHIGFEFNKGSTPCPAPSTLVRRTAGDMLIVYDFEGGAADTPTITLRRWVTSGSCEVGSASPPCWGPSTNLTALGFAEAKVNTTGAVSDTIGPSSPASESLGTNEFGEAGINLTDAGVFSPNVCEAFGKTYAVSRSSGNSATAQMKDLVGPGNINITNCGNVIIRKVTVPSPDPTDTTFGYTTTGGLSAGFGLKNGQNQSFSNVLTGSYSVTETDPAPTFAFTSLDCSASNVSHGTTINTSGRTVSFDLKPLDTVDCTYTNTLQQGALRILKTSTKTGNPLVSTAGAAFSVTGSTNFTVRDNNTGSPAGTKSDASATIGEICVPGLLPGSYTVNETTPPPGYGGATQTNLTAVVVVGTNCTANEPAAADTAVFTNAPLADIQVNVRDGGSGETSADSITCTAGTTTSTTPPSGWDSSITNTGIPIDPSPRTITCTIVIDP